MSNKSIAMEIAEWFDLDKALTTHDRATAIKKALDRAQAAGLREAAQHDIEMVADERSVWARSSDDGRAIAARNRMVALEKSYREHMRRAEEIEKSWFQ